MIRKNGYRFSEKIMLKQKTIERDDDSKKSHPVLAESRARNQAVRDCLGFGGFNRTDYRSAAKRTLRSARDTDARTAGRLISCQNFESVADWILSQW